MTANIGAFTVELIHRDSGKPFPSHRSNSNGKTYIEVEPDTEYFIRIRSLHNKKVMCDIEVDGESLGYWSYIEPMTAADNGIFSCSNGDFVYRALKFEKTPFSNSAVTFRTNAHRFWTGQVKVEVYEAIEDGYERVCDHQSPWQGGDVGFIAGLSEPGTHKGVKTGIGSNCCVKKFGREAICTNFSTGRKLETITVNYCSVFGLIFAGLLPKPPSWVVHRMFHGLEDDETNFQYKRIKVGAVEDIVPAKEYDFFDLT